MMQAFRSSAKIIAIVFAVLMVLFLIQLSGIGGGGGTVSSTSVGRVNGTSIDTRTYQQVVQNRIQAIQQQSSQTLTLDDIEQIRDEVWEEFVSNTVLTAEYGRRKIRVNAICPGVVETPMYDAVLGLGLKSHDEIANMHPLGRTIRPEEIADLALFLASEESSAITGQAIVIDGGLLSECNLTGVPPVA